MEDGSMKELHINKLQPYVQRFNHVGLIFEQDEDFRDIHYTPADKINQTAEDIRKHFQDMQACLAKE